MRPVSRMTIVLGMALSALSFGVQEYSLSRYNLYLDIPEMLWVQLGVGWAFLLAGLAANRARPISRIGAWMVLFGLVWIGSLVFTAPAIQWHAVGWAVALFGLLFVILYSFPSGRLHGWERWAAGGWIAIVSVVALWAVALEDFYGWVDDSVCCPSHLLFVGENPDLQERILTVGLILASAVIAAVVVVQAVRWRRSTVVGRRGLTTLGVALLPIAALLFIDPVVNALTHGISGLLGGISGEGLSPSPLPGRRNLYLQNGVLILLPGVILAGLLRSRLSHARVGDLVHDLGAPLAPDDLEARLQETLGDPRARLAFPREETDDHVGVDGKTLLVFDREDMLLTPLDDQVSILHDQALDRDLVVSAGTAASLAINNARLQAELRAQLLEVQESRRRLVKATDEARWRVERDLHDGAQQRLVVLSATLRRALDRNATHDPGVHDLLAAAAREADVAIDELRELARGVHPAILTQAGLGPAVASLVDRAPIPVRVGIGTERHSPAVEATVYFVIAESLSNIFKHSGAVRAEVVVRREGDDLVIEVHDDGRGGADAHGSGLRGLGDRVGALGGWLEIGSGHAGGSTLTARIPLAEE